MEINDIYKVVAKYFRAEQVKRFNNRCKDSVKVRHFTFLLARELTELTYAQIGSFFNKDHSTVVYAVKKMRNELEVYKDTASIYADLMNLLNENSSIKDELKKYGQTENVKKKHILVVNKHTIKITFLLINGKRKFKLKVEHSNWRFLSYIDKKIEFIVENKLSAKNKK